jgi:hypothetical protein
MESLLRVTPLKPQHGFHEGRMCDSLTTEDACRCGLDQFIHTQLATMTICNGGVMAAQQYQEPFTQAPAGSIEPVQRLRIASVAGLRCEQPYQGTEEEWHERWRSLQRCICELLIKNQQLRMALQSTTNHQAKEAYQ